MEQALNEEEKELLLKHMPLAPPRLSKNKKRLCKQLSMCETPRDVAWEKRRLHERRKSLLNVTVPDNGVELDHHVLTDEDLSELKGCIDLGFGFNEEQGQRLSNTLPALDLYFAVNRQLSPSPVSSPRGRASTSSLGERSSSLGNLRADGDWKICSPGDNPEQVKTKLRHWAQAVACSVKQSF